MKEEGKKRIVWSRNSGEGKIGKGRKERWEMEAWKKWKKERLCDVPSL